MPLLEQPIVSFSRAAEFRQWLVGHHADHPGIWPKLAKKGSNLESNKNAAIAAL